MTQSFTLSAVAAWIAAEVQSSFEIIRFGVKINNKRKFAEKGGYNGESESDACHIEET